MKKRKPRSTPRYRVVCITNYRDTSWRKPKLDMSILGRNEPVKRAETGA